ncbi:hypothetical protein [Clostridium sp.]|uniref:hypothetical protein n=1 Tax=Clostridium sp. TaxID=1506 RepID=UPI002FC69201
MCQVGCVHENQITGDCTLNSTLCPIENETRIDEIKMEIADLEAKIAELDAELEKLEG